MSDFDAARAVTVLRILANAPRLTILLRLLDGECGVAELESELGFRQPGLSQHLGELRDAGLVIARREARLVYYRLADAAARRLVASVLSGFGASLSDPVASPPVATHVGNPAGRPYGVARFAQVLS